MYFSFTSFKSSKLISGIGLAMASMIGYSLIVLAHSLFNALPTESPRNTSASTHASSSVLFGESTDTLNLYLLSTKSGLPV